MPKNIKPTIDLTSDTETPRTKIENWLNPPTSQTELEQLIKSSSHLTVQNALLELCRKIPEAAKLAPALLATPPARAVKHTAVRSSMSRRALVASKAARKSAPAYASYKREEGEKDEDEEDVDEDEEDDDDSDSKRQRRYCDNCGGDPDDSNGCCKWNRMHQSGQPVSRLIS